MSRHLLLIFLLLSGFSFTTSAQLPITFQAEDGLVISADWYPVNDDDPVILLCHQNRFSRGEFREIAPRLNKFGFNCLAIDQRVGDEINGVKNETAERAIKKGLKPSFADAEADIVAAVNYLYAKYNKEIIIVGSSYSASLALKVANNNPKVLGVAVFSPGEYFKDHDLVKNSVNGMQKPLFATSSKDESGAVVELLKDINSRIKVQYIPKSEGQHGCKALWTSSDGNEEYWIVLMNYLAHLKNL